MGGPCEEAQISQINIRYQPGVAIAEFWTGPEPNIPFAAVVVEPGQDQFRLDPMLHVFTSGDLHGTWLVSIHPETLDAVVTGHILSPETPAFSARGTCRSDESGQL